MSAAALGVAGMRHDAPPVVWKPRRTIAFLTETAFQGLPLQLWMPRRSSSAAIFRAACRMGLEGLVSKHRDRPYQAGRSRYWVKVKNRRHPAMYRVMDALA